MGFEETHFSAIENLIRDNEIDMRSFLNCKRGDMDETFLHYSARSGNLEDNNEIYHFLDNSEEDKKVCQFLIKYGAEVNCIDKVERTPLHKAVRACNIDITELLLKNGAYVNAQDRSKNTPLLYASTCCVELCDLLLKHGADPNIKNIFYQTPIFCAVLEFNSGLSHSKQIVKLLLHHGGDVEIRDLNQKNAIELASTLGNEDIFDWCKQNVQNSSGKKLILILVQSEI